MVVLHAAEDSHRATTCEASDSSLSVPDSGEFSQVCLRALKVVHNLGHAIDFQIALQNSFILEGFSFGVTSISLRMVKGSPIHERRLS
jgi:hypothetical protein